MIDPKRLNGDITDLIAALARKGVPPEEVRAAAALVVERARAEGELGDARAELNRLSKEVGRALAAKDSAAAEVARAAASAASHRVDRLDEAARVAASRVREALLVLPNTPAPEAPDGMSGDDNVEVRVVGGDATYGEHQRVPHWDVGLELGILDTERGAKISGAMFPLYRGGGARLLRALTNWALDAHRGDFEEIRPPSLVRTDTLVATGQLPKFADDAYHLERDDLWAIPTAEVPLTSLARDEILDEADLPLRLCAYTPCYRRESGSAGRDTRGVLRSHEFDKVELLAFCRPEQATEVHGDLLARAEALLVALGLAYRVLDICTGDLGQSHARQYDLEVYAPGCDQWLEVSSVSWFSDYQARRANVRYRRSSDGKVAPVHTLNGSALAWPRVWAAIVETYRRPDGSVAVPDVLQAYFGGETTLASPR